MQRPAQAWPQPKARLASARLLVEAAVERHRQRIVLACSFGAPAGIVLLDLVLAADREVPVFFVDTGLLFAQTHALAADLAARYGVAIRRVRPALTLEEQERAHGAALWQRDPDRCCALRKVDPARAFVAGYDAWFTGIRRTDSATRAGIAPVSADGDVLKYAPLFDWTDDDVAAYVDAAGLPVNALHAQGYPSLGCTPCTRAIAAGEDVRAGRWPGTGKTECGLHVAARGA